MRYLMRKQLFAIGDDFWVEDESGQRVLALTVAVDWMGHEEHGGR